MNIEDFTILNQIRASSDYRYDLTLVKLLFNIRCIVGTEKFQTQYWFLYFMRELEEFCEF